MTGVSVTDQRVATADASIEINEDATPSAVWGRLAEQLDHEVRLAALSLTEDCTTAGEYRTRLEDAGVTALDGLFVSACADVVEDPTATDDLTELAKAVGSGQTPVNLRSSFDDVLAGPVALLSLAEDVNPSIEVRLATGFREIRRDQRERICHLIAELAQGADVRIVATGLVQRWLRDAHREDLPVFEFSSACNPPRDCRPIEELVEQARDEIDPDSTEVVALREIDGEPAGTLSHTSLKAALPISGSRVSQVVGRLEECGLVERFGPRTERQVELSKVGMAFLDALDADIGRQAELDAEFSDSGKFQVNTCNSPGPEGAAQSPPTGRTSLVQVRSLGRTDAVGAYATAVDGGIGLVDHAVEKLDDGRTPLWWYDRDADRLVVGAQWHKAHQWLACIAWALASGRTFQYVLTSDRLDDALIDPNLHRRANCIGWYKDGADADDLIDGLDGAREDLLDLTRRIHCKKEDGDECDELYSQLARDAKGLVGTMLQLLRLIGVDVVFQLRLPSFNQNYNASHREQLVRMLSGMVGVASTHGHFSVQRQLFEKREEKRNTAITPDVDAADPFGELMPSISITGAGVTRLEEPLREAFNRREPHEDAPEMAVPIPIEDRTDAREACAEATRAMCRTKDLRPTRKVVSVLQALCGSPYDVADALYSLGKETKDIGRDIRGHDIRYALSTLDESRILPDLPPTVGRIVSALLRTEQRVSQSELADLADVSARSIRNNRSLLEAVSLLHVNNDGYRLSLSFPDERRTAVLPDLVTASMTSISDVAYDLLAVAIEDTTRLSDPSDPLGSCLFWPYDLSRLCDRAPDLDPWIRAASDLLGEEIEDTDTSASPSVATLGCEIEQTALGDVDADEHLTPSTQQCPS